MNKKKTKKLNKFEQEIENLKIQLEETRQKQIRSLADYQNLQKRNEVEKQNWIKYSNETLLLKLLEVLDNLERAAAFIKDEGLNMVQTSLSQVLQEFGVEELKVEGTEFDPETMECVEQEPGEQNIVLKIKLKGYKLYDKVLRPAKVVVGKEK